MVLDSDGIIGCSDNNGYVVGLAACATVGPIFMRGRGDYRTRLPAENIGPYVLSDPTAVIGSVQ